MTALDPDTLPVLLVEESPTDRALIARALRPRPTAVADAERVLDAVRRQSFAAVLIAHALPGRSGLDVLRELRSAGETTPIVLLADADDDGVAADALRAGADACVVKQPGFERSVSRAVTQAARQRLQVAAAPRAEPEMLRVLVFEVGEQRYGLRAADVLEIVPAVTVTPVPDAPAHVEGMLNLRGRAVPVVDVRASLGLPRRAAAHTDHLIVVGVEEGAAALRVDRATELVSVNAVRPDAGRPAGLIELRGELLFVHETRRFLSREDRAALVARRAPPEAR
jgi:purine-binding chemotaxis protein CheW